MQVGAGTPRVYLGEDFSAHSCVCQDRTFLGLAAFTNLGQLFDELELTFLVRFHLRPLVEGAQSLSGARLVGQRVTVLALSARFRGRNRPHLGREPALRRWYLERGHIDRFL